MKRSVYLDNAATTPVYPEVLEAMAPYFDEYYGNPSAFYSFADESKAAVEKARKNAASLINATEDEIYFTSGGTESNNWAIKSIAQLCRHRGKHIITSNIEHKSVLNTLKWLEGQGYDVTYLGVDDQGRVSPEEVRKAIRPDTILISVMFANNEIGSIQPIAEIGGIAAREGIYFHTDAVQAYGHEPIDVKKMKIDMLSASGHKLNGPKGIGLLYIKQEDRIRPFIHGGSQERGQRAGTLNVSGIVGLGKAAQIAREKMVWTRRYESWLRDYFIDRVLSEIPGSLLNGHRTERLTNNANFSFENISGKKILEELDKRGISASAGSACSSGALEPSHVQKAIGRSLTQAAGAVRFSISRDTTREEIDYTISALKEIIGIK